MDILILEVVIMDIHTINQRKKRKKRKVYLLPLWLFDCFVFSSYIDYYLFGSFFACFVITEKHSHSHSGGGDHGHSHDKPAPTKTPQQVRRDMNVHAVFLHYLGDALSSVLVLIAGFLLKWFDGQPWTLYVDPISSLLIVGLIMYTTIPLSKFIYLFVYLILFYLCIFLLFDFN
jgi:hypothetical protein